MASQLTLTQVASDNFNRANGAIAGANNWTAISSGGLSISSNELIGNATTSGDYRTGETYSSNQYSECVVGTVALVAGGWIGVSVRNQDNQNNYLAIYYQPSAGNYQCLLYKKVAGAYTLLLTKNLAGVQAAGTALRLVVEGSVLQVWLAGAPIMACVDTTFPSGGSPGVEAVKVNSLDNWAGGNAATGALGSAQASDAFTRADGNVSVGSGGAWVLMNYPYTPATVEIPIVSNQLSVQNPPITGHAGDVRTDAYNSDHWSQLCMGTAAMNASGFVGGTTRNQGSGGTLGNSCYLGVAIFNNAYSIYRLDSGVSTQLATVVTTGNDPAGTSYTMVSEGTRHSFRVNGSEVIFATDATYSGGAPGMMMFANSTADSWSGGNVAIPVAPAPPSISFPVRATIQTYSASSAVRGYTSQAAIRPYIATSVISSH